MCNYTQLNEILHIIKPVVCLTYTYFNIFGDPFLSGCYLGKKVPRTLGWPYTEGISLYFDYFIWCVSCTVVIVACLVVGV